MFARILSWGWLFLGVGLVIDGLYEVLVWSRDPILAESSLRWWHSTGIIPGLLAVALGYYIAKPGALRLYLGYTLAILFSVYVLYIIGITPAGYRLRPMFALQIAVIVLSFGTAVFLLKMGTIERE